MRYTYKRTAGMLAILFGIMLLARFSPAWLFYTLLTVIGGCVLYLIYYYSSY